MQYRSDIDGLRAVAILPVVFFHLGFSAFSGGYVGVDIFFVISGYLITSIIYGEMREGRFSFATFYERRIRRLLPALFTVFVATTIVASVMMLPGDLRAYSQSLSAATVFVANAHFRKLAGYFEDPADLKPLLHTWSLSVEEQFYILYPILLWLVLRYVRNRVHWALAAGALLSLVASIYVIQHKPDGVFFLLHFRAWELLIGAFLAVGALAPPSAPRAREALSLAGLGMIGYSVLFFDRDTVFPAANALFPGVGTALILYAGTGGTSLVGRLLSLRPLVFIGLISYSLYLWHWPLIVFAKYYLIRDLALAEKYFLMAAAFLLAVLSWRYIERPFRGKGALWARPAVFKASAASALLFISTGFAGSTGNGFPQRVPAEVSSLAVAPAHARHAVFREQCLGRPTTKLRENKACHLGQGERASFLLWGDSHALAMAPAIDDAATAAGRMGLIIGGPGCPPLLGVRHYNAFGKTKDACRVLYKQVMSLLENDQEIRTVVLVARWAINSEGVRFGSEPGKSIVISPDGLAGNPKVFREALERTLRYLTRRNLEVIIVTQVPEIGWHVPSVLARSAYFGRAAPAGPTRERYTLRQRTVTTALDELARGYRFRVVDVSRVLCPGPTCLIQQDGNPLYLDDDHLSRYGTALVSPVFRGVL